MTIMALMMKFQGKKSENLPIEKNKSLSMIQLLKAKRFICNITRGNIEDTDGT